MKLILMLLLFSSPVLAHEGEHYFPLSVNQEEQYLNDRLNHSMITCNRVECMDYRPFSRIEHMPEGNQRFLRYPYYHLL